VSITSQDLLQRAEQRTGLARNQLLLMVAKSAAVRHIAQGRHSDRRSDPQGLHLPSRSLC
jgi:fructose-1,6-bisphosphatase/sedoheptulose 1,7-bisphosphatase-like protein